MEQTIHFCTTADGARIAYAKVGQGPPLLKAANWLSHLEFDWRSPIWRHLLAEFSRDHTFIRYDERGNGLSDWNCADLSFQAWVQDLESVVESAGLERFPLLGISQGGAVAIAYAARHPERVSHLILYGAYARGWATRESPEEIEQRQAQLTLVKLGWGKDNPAFRQLWTTLYAPDATPVQAQSFNDLQRVSTSPENAVRLLNEMGNIDVVDLLPQVNVPTLVLHCRDESGVPFEEGRLLAASIPGARFVPLNGRNHLLLEGDPSWGTFVKEVRSFLGTEITSALALDSASEKSQPRPRRTDLPERYTIISFLGVGGMGEVHLAEDTKLGRKVALKTLPAEFTNDRERLRRFQQEARAASALNHPNLLTIHEIGEENGTHFMATEYIDGVTLRAKLKRGRMTLDEALEVAQQAAFALTAAHGAAIVHRDIKPENIMVRLDGIVKVLDFGLAKLLEDHQREMIDPEADTRALVLTDPGKVLGTPQYMSPEQARGMDLDARTDIWSLGVVIYEMVAGRAPFRGETKSHTVVEILETEPPPLAQFAPDTPAELQRIVRKALTKDRDNRYQTARDLMIDLKSLRRELDIQSEIDRSSLSRANASGQSMNKDEAVTPVHLGSPPVTGLAEPRATRGDGPRAEGSVRYRVGALVAMVLITMIVLGIYFWKRGSTPIGGETIDSIAVLPFENLSHDQNTEYLSDGVTESLINSLSQLPRIKVIARNSVFTYKNQTRNLQQVAQKLNVRALLTGRVLVQGDMLDVRVELTDAQSNTQLWGDHYVRKAADIFTVQDEIARQVTDTLRVRLTGPQQEQLTKRYTENVEAYQLYLKGRYFADQYTDEGFKKAVEHFNAAIQKDPKYTLAHAGLAEAYWIASAQFLPPRDAMPKSREAAVQALRIDDTLAEAHTSLALVEAFYDYDLSRAEREFKRAIELNPGSASAHQWYGWYLFVLKRAEEALREIKRAQELDPLSVLINGELGMPFYFTRQYDRAIEEHKKAVGMNPDNSFARIGLARNYIQKGKYEEAIAIASTPEPDDPYLLAIIGEAYARLGKKAEAQKMIERLNEQAKRRYIPPYAIAYVYLGLGKKQQALDSLEESYENREDTMIWLNSDPVWDSLRSEPRFQDLVRRVGLSQ